MLVDNATQHLQHANGHRTFDQNGVRQLTEPSEAELGHIIDNLCFERRDKSIFDEIHHETKFSKELALLFEKTEGIQQSRIDTVVFSMTNEATDSGPKMRAQSLAHIVMIAIDTS